MPSNRPVAHALLRPPSTRRVRSLLAAGIGLWAGLLLAGRCSTTAPRDLPPLPNGLGVLAVGDTGQPALLGMRLFDKQLAVGEALRAEDERRPADILLFLGDNFYPDGLRRPELVRQIRRHVVRPYCRFVDLSGARSEEVAGACEVPPEERRPLPMLAVLGNHDYDSEESPQLEQAELRRFVVNWRMPKGMAEVFEFKGLSFILYDSTRARTAPHLEPLVAALRSARGPWRVLAAHHPLDDTPPSRAIRQAIAAAGVAVHLHLAGHEHNLQVGELAGAGPPLQVVSGAGSRPKRPNHPIPKPRFLDVALGFARLELVGGSPERLVVSLIEVPPPMEFWRSPHEVARWSVDAALRVRDEFSDAPIAARPGSRASSGPRVTEASRLP